MSLVELEYGAAEANLEDLCQMLHSDQWSPEQKGDIGRLSFSIDNVAVGVSRHGIERRLF